MDGVRAEECGFFSCAYQNCMDCKYCYVNTF